MSREDIKMGEIDFTQIENHVESAISELRVVQNAGKYPKKVCSASMYGANMLTAQKNIISVIRSELDKLKQERDEAVAITNKLLQELFDIQSMCIGQIAMDYALDGCNIGNAISVATGMTHPELKDFLSKLKGDE